MLLLVLVSINTRLTINEQRLYGGVSLRGFLGGFDFGGRRLYLFLATTGCRQHPFSAARLPHIRAAQPFQIINSLSNFTS